MRKFRQHILDIVKHFIGKVYLQDVRFWEVPIIVSVFLASHRSGFALVIIEPASFLNDTLTSIQQTGLPLDFIVNGTGDCFQRVQVLDFCTSTQFFIIWLHDGNVDIATQRTLLHLTVTNSCILQQQADFFYKCLCFFRRANIRFCYDFNQRNPATVIVCQRNSVEIIMNQLTGIFFQMNPVDSDIFLSFFCFNFYQTINTQRTLQLRNLISLRQVRIKIVFPVKYRKFIDVAAQCKTSLYSILYSSLIDDWQCSRHTCTNRAATGVRTAAKLCTTSTEYF